ncbi:MAG: hypothetical protein V1912_12135, partial [bacterium]
KVSSMARVVGTSNGNVETVTDGSYDGLDGAGLGGGLPGSALLEADEDSGFAPGAREEESGAYDGEEIG